MVGFLMIILILLPPVEAILKSVSIGICASHIGIYRYLCTDIYRYLYISVNITLLIFEIKIELAVKNFFTNFMSEFRLLKEGEWIATARLQELEPDSNGNIEIHGDQYNSKLFGAFWLVSCQKGFEDLEIPCEFGNKLVKLCIACEGSFRVAWKLTEVKK